MKKVIYIIGLVSIICLLFILTGCSENNTNNVQEKSNKLVTESTQTENEVNTNSNQESETLDYKLAAEKQMAMPVEGETVATIKIKGYGNVKVKFFPEVAPKAVENFIKHAQNGYYDGLTFHRVINEFMIQGGDPDGNGTGGESIWGTGFGTELSQELVPYRGSLCMAMSSLPNSIGSQFFITQAHYDATMESYLKSGGYPIDLIEQYKTYGGYLSLYLNYTVFGQVYEGMDVIDAVAKTETNPENDKPLEDVVIDKIEVTTYKAK